MRLKSRIVWKLSLVFVLVIFLLVAATGYLNGLADERQAVRSLRDVSRLQSRTIIENLRERMLAGDKAACRALVADLAASSPLLSDLRLVDHEGFVRGGRDLASAIRQNQHSRSCRVCHDLSDPEARLRILEHDEVIAPEGGDRFVAVTTPILNEPACATAGCHADDKRVLGFLQADYTLAEVDAMASARLLHNVLVAGLAILLALPLVWLLANRMIDRPVRALNTGMGKIGEGDFSFRFDLTSRDEFGTLGASLNEMAEKLESTVTELRETRDYFEGIVENSADLIITANPQGYIYTFNRGAEELLGYPRGQMIGRSTEMLFADEEEQRRMVTRLRGVEDVVNYETHLLTAAGEVRDVILTMSRIREPSGKTVGWFNIGKDVTEAKRMQKQIVDSERFAAIGQSVAGIQHSLKNMLNALKGGSYMVKIGLKKDDRDLLAEGWGMVHEGIQNLTSMSTSMLKYVREWKPEFARVDVPKFLGEVEGMIRPAAEERGVEFTVEVAEDAPTVLCDSRLLHSAVMDILSNALDACAEKEYRKPERPAVSLWGRPMEDDSRFVIGVRDNGCGMTPEVRANVFTPFFSTKKNWGTGLGLALTSRTIRMHGGEIQVESESDVGTEFRIIVPVGGPDEDKEKPDGEEGAGRR